MNHSLFLRKLIALTIVAVCAVLTPYVHGRCKPEWLPGGGVPGVVGQVYAITHWDPDGDGPTRPLVIVGGDFSVAGNHRAANIAAWDGASWLTLGSGLNAPVFALAVFDDGAKSALYAGGEFTMAGEVTTNGVAKWDGISWSPLRVGVEPPKVYALAVFDDGMGAALYAGGEFVQAGGLSSRAIGKWNGRSWSPLGHGIDGKVLALAVYHDGIAPGLFVGGDFRNAGQVPADRIAKWSGASWSSLGTGMNGAVRTLTAFDDGTGHELYAGGTFQNAGGVNARNLAKWNGTGWTGIGNANRWMNGSVNALTVLDRDGGPELFVGGSFSSFANNSWYRGIAGWNGFSWSGLGFGPQANALHVFDDGYHAVLYAGGRFQSTDDVGASAIAQWNGTSWKAMGSGLNSEIQALTVFDDGSSHSLAATSQVGVMRWDGSSWHTVGRRSANALTVFDDGNGASLYAGDSRVSRWNGLTWFALPEVQLEVQSMASFDSGSGPELYAGGRGMSYPEGQDLMRWDGASWSSVGGGPSHWVNVLATLDDGTGPALYAGGWFHYAGGIRVNMVAKWDGSSWSSLGTGIETPAGFDAAPVYALAVFNDGTGTALFVGGSFFVAGEVEAVRVAKWDGVTWSPLGAGVSSRVLTLSVFDDGNGPALYAGGLFNEAGDQAANHIARWDGTKWSPLDGGLNGDVKTLSVFDDGSGPSLCVGGSFSEAGDYVSAYFARWRCPCPHCDANDDEDVDLEDYSAFVHCLGAPDAHYDPGCANRRLDAGNDIDLADFAVLQNQFTAVIP